MCMVRLPLLMFQGRWYCDGRCGVCDAKLHRDEQAVDADAALGAPSITKKICRMYRKAEFSVEYF